MREESISGAGSVITKSTERDPVPTRFEADSVTVYVPAWSGVPEIVVPERDRPGGKLPCTPYARGLVPAVVISYVSGVPTTPLVLLGLVITVGDTIRLNVAGSPNPAGTFSAAIVIGKLPELTGVPEMVPVTASKFIPPTAANPVAENPVGE